MHTTGVDVRHQHSHSSATMFSRAGSNPNIRFYQISLLSYSLSHPSIDINMAETIGLAVNIATVVDLLVKVGVQCSFYCAGVKTAPNDVRDILEEADKFRATLQNAEQLLSGPHRARIEASQCLHRGINDGKSQLADLVAKLGQGRTTKGWRALWPLKKAEVTGRIQSLERCRTAISLDLQFHQTYVISTITQTPANRLPRTLLENVYQEAVLTKLRVVERAGFNAHADADNARCYRGTRTDILHQILEWGTTYDSQNIFWLNGMAGTGKSTISRTIAQKFARKGILGASFFFKRGEGDRGHAAFFFSTIAAQLIQHIPPLAYHIRDEIKADPNIHNKPLREQLDKLIVNPIKNLPKQSQPSTIALVIDALDECDNLSEIRHIIQLLSRAKHFGSIWLKFFVTSRPELLIKLGFGDISGKYEDLVLQEIPQPIIKHDIHIFLTHELTKIRDDYNKHLEPALQLSPDWPGPEQIRKLVEMAAPLFIFAATVCRFIQDRRLGGPQDQLSSILGQQESRTSNLERTYRPVLDRLFTELDEKQVRIVAEKFQKIVGSIVILASPLSMTSLSKLIGLPMNSIKDQLDFFHSVLRIPPDRSSPIRPLHLSFREFLVDPEKGKEQERYPFWIDEREIHERLAAQCLHLLSTGDTLKRDNCDLRLPGTCRSDIDQQTIDAKLPPEVQYACRYWVYHRKESKCLIRDGDAVHCFLSHYLLYWLEVLGLIGRISDSISMVDDLLGLLDVCSFTTLRFYRVIY